MLKKLLFVLIVAMSAQFPDLKAQQKDLGLWTSLRFKKNIIGNLDANLRLEYRLNNNLLRRKENFLEAGLSYKYGLFATDFSYRFSQRNMYERQNGYLHAYYMQVRFIPTWKSFSFEYRLRLHTQYFNYFRSDLGRIPTQFLRNRLKVSYKIQKWNLTPSFSYDYFYQLNRRGVDDFRLVQAITTINYKINNKNSFDLSYIFMDRMNVPDPLTEHIVGLTYKFVL